MAGELPPVVTRFISDVTQFNRGIDDALAKLKIFAEEVDQVDRQKIKIPVDVDTSKANAQLAGTTKELHLLSTAIVGVGPALIPVAAVAAGAFAGLIGTAGTAALAFAGIKAEMKAGTPVGEAYSAAFKGVTDELTSLEKTAAVGTLKGIQQATAALVPLYPTLNRDVAKFSGQLGDIAGHVAPGLVSVMLKLNPLFVDIGNELVKGSAGFEKWATSSQSLKNFVAYAQVHLPDVERTLGQLFTTASHVVQGFAQFGSTMLTSIRLLSTAINAIPIGALQTLLPLLAGLKIGNTLKASISNAATSLGSFAAKAEKAGGVASGAAGVVGNLGKAVGFLGPVGTIAGLALGGLSIAMGSSEKAAEQQTAAVNDLVQAIQNGTAASGAWTNAQQTGAAAGTKIGLTQKQIITAITGTKSAYDAAQKSLDDYQRTHLLYTTAQGQTITQDSKEAEANREVIKTTRDLKAGLEESRTEYDKAKQAVVDFATSQGDSTLAAQISNDSYLDVAATLGVTGDAYLSAQLAADKQAASTTQATLQMQLENNAAGLLNNALNTLAGQNLSVAQAQTALDSAILTGTATLKKNKSSLDEHTQAGIDDRQAIEGIVSAARAKAQADAQGGTSTEQVTAAYQRNAKQILDNIAKLNGDKTATDKAKDSAYQYALQLLKIPPVAKTKIDVDTDAANKVIADFKTRLAAIQSKNVTITVNGSKVPPSYVSIPGGGVKRLAAGGLVRGPGSAKSDSVPIMGSAGEFMMPADVVGKPGMLPFLEALRSGGDVPVAAAAPAAKGRGDTYVTIQVEGSVIDHKGLFKAVQTGALQYGTQNTQTWQAFNR